MEVKNSLTTKKENKLTFSNYITNEVVKRKINSVLGGEKGLKFISSIISAISTNPALQDCDNGSILSGALMGASLNLQPSTVFGHYYLVPYNDKSKGKVAQFQIGYKGYIYLAIQSGYYKDLNVIEVRKGEYLGREKSTGKYQFSFIEDDDEREKLPIIGYMASLEYLNGFTKTMYWSKEKMLKHADTYSKAFSVNATTGENAKVSFVDFEAGKVNPKDLWKYSSFWYKDFNEMACKTMLRQIISKWGIMSTEMQKAYTSDMGIINENEQVEYVDNPLNNKEVVEEKKELIEENNPFTNIIENEEE